MSTFYLGQFPPPYGGVTVKNALLFEALSERLSIEKLEFRKTSTSTIIKRLLTSRDDTFVLGFGNAKLQRYLLCGLSLVRPSVLSRCVLIVMGGKFSETVGKDGRYLKACSRLRGLYVETESMAEAVRESGLEHARVFPNCRKRPSTAIKVKMEPEALNSGRLSCVFFSLVSSDKGVDLVLDAADALPEVDFFVYGRIERGYEGFEGRVARLGNVTYMGVFDSVRDDVVAELNKYDVHLFPTRWPNEGVPGVLVETKMAAVPSIVSDVCYNTELVRDGSEGVVLRRNTAEELARAISSLDADREKLGAMKAAALESAERFYIDRYIDWLVSDLSEEPRKRTS